MIKMIFLCRKLDPASLAHQNLEYTQGRDDEKYDSFGVDDFVYYGRHCLENGAWKYGLW